MLIERISNPHVLQKENSIYGIQIIIWSQDILNLKYASKHPYVGEDTITPSKLIIRCWNFIRINLTKNIIDYNKALYIGYY